MGFAYVRALKLKNIQYLIKQGRHALRKDTTSEVRPGAKPGTAVIWTPPDLPEGVDPRDYRALYRLSKNSRGFAERQNAAIGLHLLVGVSSSWIKAAGGLHDPENPRNEKLRDAAVAWVESWAGAGSVIGARLDLDEAGGGVVDVFVVPVFEQKHKSGSTKLTVSVNKALTGLQATHKSDYSYEALQTSWHAYAQEHLDKTLQRGEPKYKTNREHLSIAEYKRQQDHLQKEAALRKEQEELADREAAVADREAAVAERERLAEQARADLEWEAAEISQERVAFKAAIAVLSDPGLRAIRPPSHEGSKWRFDTPHLATLRPAILQARPLWPVMHDLLAAAQDKHRVADRRLAELHALRDEVDEHLRECIDEAACEAGPSWMSGRP
ncbi:hypothetical protein [Microvirga tunisiensis]|uniref:Uncharacterized protein n=1 Tax=Microvirga tunisiensis TaxID=2108360 RepID=A0A5N7MQK1_9HYPH|nr:hypothetical protein [Microvirga tunisiensis]MPR10302.1 hypothetical protein [Microvirga tunisiensis]MPR28930.1 hypothetical protein [Microvirga tunisiensis]